MSPATEGQKRAIREALVAVGAPVRQAVQLADEATLEECEGELMLCLKGACCSMADQADQAAIEELALNAAADNAEAHDRQQRGEADWTPWWPLPERRPRR